MRKKAKFSSVLLSGIIVFTIAGCNFFTQPVLTDNDVLPDNNAVNSATPYADIAQLTQLAKIEGNVDWRIARFFALESLEVFRQANDWNGAVLSERPLIIYRESTGLPRYYEYRVIRGGEEIGAIACVVEKNEGDAVQYVLPFATQISTENARSIYANQGKLIDAGYPANMLVRTTSNGRSVNPGTGIEETNDNFTDVKIREFLEQLNPEDLEFYGITTQEIYDKYIGIQLAEEKRIQTFWEKVYDVKEEILALTEEEILEAFNDDTKDARATLVSAPQWTLPDWTDKIGWKKPNYKLVGGPAAMYFVTLGLGPKSGYSEVPLTNDQAKIDAMYKAYEKLLGTDGCIFSDMDNALLLISKYNYHLFMSMLPNAHTWLYSHSSIVSNRLPVISLRSGKTLTGEWHYRVIIGTRSLVYQEKKTFLWATWIDEYKTDWYYMWDAGPDSGGWGKAFWEKDGQLYQFQTCRVERR